MKFKELVNRLTGISCPVFGISWNPPELERSIARKIIIYLEARRVLYRDLDYESLHPCIISVTEIRNYLTSELSKVDEISKLDEWIRAMRTACNRFLNRCWDDKNFRENVNYPGSFEYLIFVTAVGELRGTFGVMVGQIAKAYGIDVQDELASIIPK